MERVLGRNVLEIIGSEYEQPQQKDEKHLPSVRCNFPPAFFLLAYLGGQASSQIKTSTKKTLNKEKTVTQNCNRTFEVKVTPLPAEENIGDPIIGACLWKNITAAV
jgi:hypothetical protein